MRWQLLEIGGRQALSLVVFSAMARLLEPESFGVAGMVLLYLVFAGLVVEMGLSTAIVGVRELHPEHLDSAFWFVITMASGLIGVTAVLADVVGSAFGEPTLAPYLRVGAFSLLGNALGTVHTALFIRAMDFRRPAMRTLGANLAGAAVGLGAAASGLGVWALIAQQVTASIAGAAVLWFVSSWRPAWRFSWGRLREMLAVGAAISATTALWVLASRADQFFIGRSFGAGVLGVYVVGWKLNEMARLAIHQPLSAVALPAVAQLQGETTRLRRACYEAMGMVALVGFPAFVGLAATAPSIVPFLFGVKWQGAVVPLQLLSVYSLVNLLQVLHHPLMVSLGRPSIYLWVNVAHVFGAVVACIVGAQFGVPWVVVGMIASTSVVGLCSFVYLRRVVGLSVQQYWGPCVPPAIAAVGMGVVVVLIPLAMGQLSNVIVARLAAQVLVGVAVYVLTLHLIAPRTCASLRLRVGGWTDRESSGSKVASP